VPPWHTCTLAEGGATRDRGGPRDRKCHGSTPHPTNNSQTITK